MRTLTFLTAILCLAASPALAEDRQPTSEVLAEIRITCDPKSILHGDVITKALADETRVLKAIKTILPSFQLRSPVADVARVSLVSGFDVALPGIVVLNLQVESYDPQIDAKKLLELLAKMLEQDLASFDAQYQLDMKSAAEEGRICELLAADLSRNKVNYAKLCAKAGVDADPAVAAQRRLQLETEYQRVSIELQGLEARQVVIEQQIAKYGEQINKIEGPDAEILGELQKSVAARKRIVEFQHAALTGRASGGSVEELEKAKDELAKAEAEEARQRRAVAAEAGGRRIDELRQRLDDTVIEREELSAKKNAISELRNASNFNTVVDQKRIEIELRQQEYRERAIELSKLRAAVQRHVSPIVEIITDEPAPERPDAAPAK
jgi:hypothetical protein